MYVRNSKDGLTKMLASEFQSAVRRMVRITMNQLLRFSVNSVVQNSLDRVAKRAVFWAVMNAFTLGKSPKHGGTRGRQGNHPLRGWVR